MKDLKYLAAYTIPLTAFFGLSFNGIYSFLTPVYAFVFIPIIETLLPSENKNLTEEEVKKKNNQILYDWLLYLNLPLVILLLLLSLQKVTTENLVLYEFIGLILSLGIVLGTNGINVAHELGHRLTTSERFIGKALLLPCLYMHFYIEHNFGHHLHAATSKDPATAQYNQSLYSFWITSTVKQYISAWTLQNNLLKKNNYSFLSLRNDMLWYSIFQLMYLIIIYITLGKIAFIFIVFSGISSILLLETINYIEHYGLLRKKTKSGRYERVREIHSWNSNHVVGRIVLYELTRHSDHHKVSSKKYQILDCHDDSPQMPFGYPTSMVMALCPPLWFFIMNKRVPKSMIP